ncbi:hypothetical protein MASR2M32_34800 [Sphaerotilus sulfidivorans]
MEAPFPLIVEVLGRSEQGVTRPFLCLADDGHKYYVKSRGALWTSVVHEWVGSRLAQEFGLPVAPFTIVEVDEILSDELGDFDLEAGLAFGSRVAHATHEFEPSRTALCTAAFRQDLLAFDWWIRNQDRLLGPTAGRPNLLWQTTTQRPVVIDHNNAFDPDFNVAEFLSLHVCSSEWTAITGDLWRRTEYEQRFTPLIDRLPVFWRELPHNWTHDDSGTARITMESIQSILTRVDLPDFWNVS